MRKTLSGNSESMKKLNRSAVLYVIQQYGEISKADIAEKTHLTVASIANIISEFLRADLIYKGGYGNSSGGRKPILYRLKSSNNYVIGIDISVTKIRAAIVNLGGQVIDQVILDKQANEKSPIIDRIFSTVDNLLGTTIVDKRKIYAIGISSPGPIAYETGSVISSPNITGLNHVPIRNMIKERYNLMTLLEKDANAAALGEQWFGSAKGIENVIYVLADQGIGGGIIFQGRIYRGFLNGAGEIGHGTIDVSGPRCNCGNYGCLEALASGIAIVRRIKEELLRGQESVLKEIYEDDNSNLTLEHVLQAGSKGDELAIRILDESIGYLGIGIANVINLFNLEEIIIGGSVIHAHKQGLENVKNIAAQRCLFKQSGETVIKRSLFLENSQVIGAASVVIEHLFDHPEELILLPRKTRYS